MVRDYLQRQLQTALLGHEIDLAVHSLKDLPTEDVDGLQISAIPPRETTEDALCLCNGAELNELGDVPENAIVGTGSVRRAAQLLHMRPDLEIRDIRGNVDTRLKKLDSGQYDAIVLAAAGLTRLGLQNRISVRFEQSRLLPAVGQGALGLETRTDDSTVVEAVSELSHFESFSSALSERSMLRRLYAGCLAPVGSLSRFEKGELMLTGVVLSRDGRIRIEASGSAPAEQFENLGIVVAEKTHCRRCR